MLPKGWKNMRGKIVGTAQTKPRGITEQEHRRQTPMLVYLALVTQTNYATSMQRIQKKKKCLKKPRTLERIIATHVLGLKRHTHHLLVYYEFVCHICKPV